MHTRKDIYYAEKQIYKNLPKMAKSAKSPELKRAFENRGGQVHDAGMLAAAQTVEHYEIAPYETLIAWANRLGVREASKLLGETLDEEKKTDRLLTQLAEANIN
jgi:ferritin-like metal-binding protein YciE